MSYAATDDNIRTLLGVSRSRPIAQLKETDDQWKLDTFSILKYGAQFSNGWGHSLRPESRFYKRWFEFPDIGARGWAIIFRVFDPVGEPQAKYEYFPGWVPPEREAEADEWISFLNARIKDRLREAAEKAATTPAATATKPAAT